MKIFEEQDHRATISMTPVYNHYKYVQNITIYNEELLYIANLNLYMPVFNINHRENSDFIHNNDVKIWLMKYEYRNPKRKISLADLKGDMYLVLTQNWVLAQKETIIPYMYFKL